MLGRVRGGRKGGAWSGGRGCWGGEEGLVK